MTPAAEASSTHLDDALKLVVQLLDGGAQLKVDAVGQLCGGGDEAQSSCQLGVLPQAVVHLAPGKRTQ